MPEIALPVLWQPMIQQQVYRQLLHAMAYPGRVCELKAIIKENRALDAIAATMIDSAVSLSDTQDILGEEFLRFSHARQSLVESADWVVVDGRQPLMAGMNPSIGTLEQPESSSTVLLQVDMLGEGQLELAQMSGPGIIDSIVLQISGLHPSWIRARQQWCSKFPQGLDMIFCSESAILALPRTTLLKVFEEEM